MSTTENLETPIVRKGDLYRLEVAIYWPGNRYAGDTGVQWKKRFETPQAAWSEALDTQAWFHTYGREVEMWLYQDNHLVGHAARR